MRKLLCVLGVVLVMAVAVALVLPSILDINRYHDQVQAEMQKRLRRQVSLGALRLSLLPPAVRVENATIAEDPAFATGQPFAQVRELRVTAKLWPLIRGRIELSAVDLLEPRIELVRNEQGLWNFASLTQAQAVSSPAAPSLPASPAPPPAAPTEPEPDGFVLANLEVSDGTVGLTDLQQHAPRAIYEHIDISVDDYATGKAFSGSVAARLPGKGAGRVELKGDVGPILANNYAQTPLRAKFKLEEVTVGGVQRFLRSSALAQIDGVISGKGEVTNGKGHLASAGSITLEKGTIRGSDLGYTIAVKYDLSEELTTGRIEIARGDLKLGSTPISISGVFELKTTPATADLRVQTSEVSIAEAARLAVLFGADVATSVKIEGRVRSDLRLRGPLSGLAMNGTLTGRDLEISGGELRQPVVMPSVTLTISPAELRSDSFQANTGGSSLAAQFTIARYSMPDANLDLTVNSRDADLAGLMNIAKSYGVAAIAKYSGSGRVDAELHLTGPLHGGGFTYNGTVTGRNLNVTGGDLKQPVQLPAISLTFSPQAIRSNSFQVTTGGSTLSGQFAVNQYNTPAAVLDLTAKTQNAELGEVLNAARAYGVPSVEGVSGTGSIDLDLHAVGPIHGSAPFHYSGTGRVRNASISLAAFSKPVKVTNADIQFVRDSAVLNNLSATIGQTNLAGSLAMRDFLAPQVKFALTADKLIVSEWQQILVSGQSQHADASSHDWSILPRAYAATSEESILMRATGTGTLSVGTILYDQLMLSNVRSDVTLQHGIIRLSPLTADVYGGRETGVIVIDTHPNPFKYEVNLKMQKVDANQFLSSVSNVKQTLYGLLAGNTSTTFSSTSADGIARSLNGTATVDLTSGKINNMDLMYELARQAKFLGIQRDKKPFTNVARLSGDFVIRSGVATTQNLQAVIDEGKFSASGSANLVDQTLNLKVVAVLNKNFSDQVGSTQVGGFMTTALANSQGELVIPVIVSGSFSQPKYAPDVAAIAQMKVNQLLPTLANPGKLSDIVGSFMGKKAAPSSQTTQGKLQPGTKKQTTKDALLDIFNSLSGGQQQQPPQQRPQQPDDEPR